MSSCSAATTVSKTRATASSCICSVSWGTTPISLLRSVAGILIAIACRHASHLCEGDGYCRELGVTSCAARSWRPVNSVDVRLIVNVKILGIGADISFLAGDVAGGRIQILAQIAVVQIMSLLVCKRLQSLHTRQRQIAGFPDTL